MDRPTTYPSAASAALTAAPAPASDANAPSTRRGRGPWPLPPLAQWDSAAAGLGFAMLALVPVLMLAAVVDPRTLQGASLWTKPIKFALAFAAYLLTLGWFSAYVRPAWRMSRRFRFPMAAGAATIAMEQAIIVLQSARGVGSHFNAATDFDAMLYAVMGIGSLVLTAMALPVAAGLMRHAEPGRLDDGMRHAMAVGLSLAFLLTLATAGAMAVHGGHGVGTAIGSAGPGLPLWGWRRDGGDLRVPHFFATHAMHGVPALAAVLPSLRRAGRGGAWALGGAWAALTLALFAQAWAGRPFVGV